MPEQTNLRQNLQAITDAELIFKDAGLVAASAAAEVSSAAKVIDTGGGFFEGKMVIDLTAIEVDTGDEIYGIHVQGSNSSTFASGFASVCSFECGDAAVITGDADTAVGRYMLPFNNQVGADIYRYLRVYTTVAGTIVTGINYTAMATLY